LDRHLTASTTSTRVCRTVSCVASCPR
jgi:hypothetical protein